MAKQTRLRPEESVAKLWVVGVFTGQSKSIGEAIRAIAATEPTR